MNSGATLNMRAMAQPMPVCRRPLLLVRCVAQPKSHAKVCAKSNTHQLYSVAVPAFTLAAAARPGLIYSALKPQADFFNTLGLPEWLIHWGHPGNMAVVLFAMGGYGAAYLGWQIRVSDDDDLIQKAKDLHPKLAIGMTFFFAAGAAGGLMSLIMQGQPIFSSPHATTGIIGLVLLSLQAMLTLFFAEDPSVRTAHAYLGTGIMALFLVHASLGLKLGLSI